VRGWTLTAAGFVGAQELIRLAPYPTEPVRPQFLEKMTWLSELFVHAGIGRLVPLRRAVFPFRWVPDTGRWYAIRRAPTGGKPMCVVPDAIVEFHGAQRRVFIDAERGTHAIVVSTAKTGATIVKLDRYTGFFRDRTEFSSDATSYTAEFGDALTPELVFLVQTDGRKGGVERRSQSTTPSTGARQLALGQVSAGCASRPARRIRTSGVAPSARASDRRG